MIIEQHRPLLVVVLGIASLVACGPGGGSWEEYQSERFGYTIAYPGDWTLVEAQPWEPEMVRASESLAPGELEKITVSEPPGPVWPGQFVLRALPNPERGSLEEWFEDFDLANLSSANMTDTTLAGLPAKRWKRFAFDLIHDEIVTVLGDRAFLLSFNANEAEDPDLEAHRGIYEHILGSFTLRQ